MKFSERYGYTKPVDVLKCGFLDEEGISGLCTCFDCLKEKYDARAYQYSGLYLILEEAIWCYFLKKRKNDFGGYGQDRVVATAILESYDYEWYEKFDLIEFVIKFLRDTPLYKNQFSYLTNFFVHSLNSTFKRLNYAYRVVDDIIVEIVDDEEIVAIETAGEQESTIKTHLSSALRLLSDRPIPDYRNSIKESISAVEVLCRKITGETTLGAALKELEKKGIMIPSFLKSGFEKLYVYTNDSKTGIRHALMEDKETPKYEEAKFMVVACSAFINYIQGKKSM